jgi:hypothetical protein
MNNNILPEVIERVSNLYQLQTVIYSAAQTVTHVLSIPALRQRTTFRNNDKPPWLKRLENKIEALRKDINIMTSHISGVNSRRVKNKVRKICQQYQQHTNRENNHLNVQCTLDTMKQKMSVLLRKKNKFVTADKRKKNNAAFAKNEKQFYRHLKIKDIQQHNPSISAVEEYWANLWESPVVYKTEASWTNDVKDFNHNILPMSMSTVSSETLQHNLRKAHNWKTPGPDRIHNFWLKNFCCAHGKLLDLINDSFTCPTNFPHFLLKGVTYLVPKSSNFATDPSQARPITCLNTIYKLTTACLNEIIYQHISEKNIMCEEQKGCARNARGCKEQLTIDQTILEQAVCTSRNLFVGYVDYKKAFDSVPHDWLIEVLSVYKIHPTIILFLKYTMNYWKTQLELKTNNEPVRSREINIKRGIFQGDCLSPLWFCLALNPLSQLLKTSGYGFQMKAANRNIYCINHLSYMDDIKLYASTKTQLDKLIEIVSIFTHDIGMKFGLDKCKTLSIVKGKINNVADTREEHFFDQLEENEYYEYLGLKQSNRFNQKIIKKAIIQETIGRVHKITKSKLKGKFLVKAINSFAIPVLTYSFGVIKWTETELQDIQRKIRTTLTKYQCHHPKSCIERMVLPRKIGGRGLLDIHLLHDRQIISLRQYFHNKASSSELIDAICKIDHQYTPLKLADSQFLINSRSVSQKIQDWSAKVIHGKFYFSLNKENIDIMWSNQWLTTNTLFAESEGFMLAIQDEVIPTRNYTKYVMKLPNAPEDICRRCGGKGENISHIISSCPTLANNEYLARHNNVAKILYLELLKKYNYPITQDRYYLLNPDPVVENGSSRIYFDRTLYTMNTRESNRPDITLINKIENKGYLLDIAVPLSHNLESTYNTKISKYSELAEDLKKQWNLERVIVVPIVLSSIGLIPKNLVRNIEALKIPLKTIRVMQKAVLIDTCHITRRFLNS